MDMQEYFDTSKGLGILATSDAEGNVNMAVYARPHVVDENTLAFIMNERLSHANVGSNPKAAYLFREDATGYRGKRLYLIKLREEKNSPLIEELTRKKQAHSEAGDSSDRYLVYFKITRIRPLVGDAE